MKKRDKIKIHLRDDIPNPGISLFVDDRAIASAEKAYACIVSLLENESLIVEDDAGLRKSLLEATRYYWADYDYDDRTSSVELRAEILALRKALDKVEKVIQGDGQPESGFSADARAALRAQAHRATLGAGGDPVDNLMKQVEAVKTACQPIASTQSTKGPRTKGRVEECCTRLWIVRERLTGRGFTKSLGPELGELGNATTRFARPDAQFFLAVMKSIDENVTYSQVHDALRGHKRSTSRGK